MNLNADEKLTLRALAGLSDGYCQGFVPLTKRTGLTRSAVRRACRSLRRKGLAEFHTGLWTDDGEMAGAGYGPTTSGRELIGDAALPEYGE